MLIELWQQGLSGIPPPLTQCMASPWDQTHAAGRRSCEQLEERGDNIQTFYPSCQLHVRLIVNCSHVDYKLRLWQSSFQKAFTTCDITCAHPLTTHWFMKLTDSLII